MISFPFSYPLTFLWTLLQIPVNKVRTYGDLRNVLMKRIFLSALHFRINTRYKVCGELCIQFSDWTIDLQGRLFSICYELCFACNSSLSPRSKICFKQWIYNAYMKKILNWLMIHYKQYSPVTGGKMNWKLVMLPLYRNVCDSDWLYCLWF